MISEWNIFFPEEGGSIGRGFSATMRLNDKKREISATHAIISITSRGYQVMDNSINGLFINGNQKPLGKGNSTPLSDGDILDIGGYRLLTSCFLFVQASSQPAMNEQISPLFADNPFHIQEPESEPVKSIPAPRVMRVDTDLVENDPFSSIAAPKQVLVHDIVLNFNALDEDPLGERELNGSFTRVKPEIGTLLQPVAVNKQNEYAPDMQRVDSALYYALVHFLDDISPQAVETILSDFSGTGFWWRKPDYWKMYKRYFSQQAANHDWKVKFQNYFYAALKLQNERNGEKS